MSTVADRIRPYVEAVPADFRVYSDLPDEGFSLIVPQSDMAASWLRCVYPGGRRFGETLALPKEIADELIREAQADMFRAERS